MAMLDSNYSESSSNYHRKTSTESSRRSNTQASAYAVNASSGFEAPPGGVPSPPPSPDAAPVGRPSLRRQRKRSGDAAGHIREECERLFCETLKTVFLVEKDTGFETSLLMDLRNNTTTYTKAVPAQQSHQTIIQHGQPTPSSSPAAHMYAGTKELVKEYIEVWDYVAGARFRGFVAEKDDMRTMFIFFDKEVVGMDLKPGLMSLLELASSEHFDCTELIVGIERPDTEVQPANADEAETEETFKDLNRSLAWVGFELTMLDAWAGPEGCISDRYIFLSMDV
ncbi:Putative ornithine decarboxylase antizyme, acyl-CoA N-acyltransferase [Septoria linicola]|uniref:Ornithine decarboxylase antizyme n=1 Tax=Septoria linicola TaxID=215465 RepID=A0A9Q9ENJ3_9PEZI|nr:putative ornithine decarboxylase antizyme, acyl-CoA N-acyltransferase [Septoria linicola]USW56654.1 Putative ornithine decarboxylase antizyme, acyl-CoA N-acyltransferase [Septoria linicola]